MSDDRLGWKCRYAFFCWKRDWFWFMLGGTMIVVGVVAQWIG